MCLWQQLTFKESVLTLSMLRLLSSKAQECGHFENLSDPAMLVCIGKLLMSTIR